MRKISIALVTIVSVAMWTVAAFSQGLVRLESTNFPGMFIRHQNFKIVLTPIQSDLDKSDSTFKMQGGLDRGNTVSFESINFPHWYIMQKDHKLVLQPAAVYTAARDASFELAGRQLIWSERSLLPAPLAPSPARYAWRHYNFQLVLNRPDSTAQFQKDSTFILRPGPWPTGNAGGGNALTSDQSAILAAHNSYRQVCGAPNLVWDATLTANAQNWANGCH